MLPGTSGLRGPIIDDEAQTLMRHRTPAAVGMGEFIALSALMFSLVALSIDAMLPVLPAIGSELGVADPNDNQFVVSALFVGLAFGQLLYGPLSDSYGRKPAIYLGLGIFAVGCLLAMFAHDFGLLLLGRVLQGIGAAGPRTVTAALIRDQYEGRAMARVMSFVMAVFILVPAIAPAIGQIVVFLSHWRVIFFVFLVIALIGFAWFALRQPETLAPERRVPFRFGVVLGAAAEVVSTRSALGYTVATGLVFGSLVGYLNSAQQMLQKDYALGAQFPVYFAVIALAIGGASFVNARLVLRLGMQWLSRTSLLVICAASVIFFAASMLAAGKPPLWTLMTYLLPVFFCIGILFGNLNALAMEPLGHVAGVGATVVGFFSTVISVLAGTLIGQAYDGTVLPLIAGFGLLSALAYCAVIWAGRGE